jgi:hypothetical protein
VRDMDNFKVIYKILKKLEEAMDKEGFDIKTINHEAMEISEMRWNRILSMMISNGLIGGARFLAADDNPFYRFNGYNIHITLQGLQYLEENSTMKKISNTLKTIKDITPMI